MRAHQTSSSLRRPALRWHGGKWRLAPWIISHFPSHRVYVEPYGGAASVLLRKPRSYAEIYNDLDDDVVGLFRILRDPVTAERLIHLLHATPFARAEFDEAYEATDDAVERARRLIIRSFMGFGSDGHRASHKTGFRSNSSRSGTTPSHDWANYPEALLTLVNRLSGVVIECRPAIDVMRQHDSPDTLHYVDPPYLPETRSGAHSGTGIPSHGYNHEMTRLDHVALLLFLQSLQGAVVLSGYPSRLYQEGLPGWHRVERLAAADGAGVRTEVLWLNARAREATPQLFDEWAGEA